MPQPLPSATLVVRNIGAVATCDPALAGVGLRRDVIVVCVGDSIAYIGPEREVSVGDDCPELNAHGNALIPGFVDAHTHIAWLGERADEYSLRAAGATYEEIAAAGGGIRSTVRATAAGTDAELRAATLTRAKAMLQQGTTTAEVKSGYGMALDAELRQLGAIASLHDAANVPDVIATYLPLHAAPDGGRDAFLDNVIARGLPAAAPHAAFIDAFCETGAWSVDECRRLFKAARGHGLVPRLHAEQRTHSGGAMLAADVSAASADHLEHASDDDFRALAAADVTAVILPGASLVLGGPPPPGRRILDAGATLAIATDCNPGTCWSESMPLMTSLAVSQAGITPDEALIAATRGGAMSLRLTDRGMLREGMRADFIVLDTPRYLDVAYHLGGDVIRHVIAAGRVSR